jgi:hypothetical protein
MNDAHVDVAMRKLFALASEIAFRSEFDRLGIHRTRREFHQLGTFAHIFREGDGFLAFAFAKSRAGTTKRCPIS